jgi:quercetin dioxygenase-like cupin family protein
MNSMVMSAALVAAMVGVAAAQQATFKRTELQRGDLTAGGREAVMAVAEIPGGVESGRHTHPGEEIGYVLEGSVVLEMDGKPARTLKAGEAFIIPNGQIHNARNSGTGAARVLATYIVEKGKPVATPVK